MPRYIKKYELTEQKMTLKKGLVLYRIRALRDFALVRKGDLGGWIENEHNLSTSYDYAWVAGNAKVYGEARVEGDGWVTGNARVYGNAQIIDEATVENNAVVYGNAHIFGKAEICNEAVVSAKARIGGESKIESIYDYVTISPIGEKSILTLTRDGMAFSTSFGLAWHELLAECRKKYVPRLYANQYRSAVKFAKSFFKIQSS